jgi:hypothetical protein
MQFNIRIKHVTNSDAALPFLNQEVIARLLRLNRKYKGKDEGGARRALYVTRD